MAMRAMMVEQLGLAMMPPFLSVHFMPAMASGFTSGITCAMRSESLTMKDGTLRDTHGGRACVSSPRRKGEEHTPLTSGIPSVMRK